VSLLALAAAGASHPARRPLNGRCTIAARAYLKAINMASYYSGAQRAGCLPRWHQPAAAAYPSPGFVAAAVAWLQRS